MMLGPARATPMNDPTPLRRLLARVRVKPSHRAAVPEARRPRTAEKAPAGPRRLKREAREQQIVSEAIRYFAEVGFGGDTRALAKRLGVTQPLLFRYFPTKHALVERVYQEVFVSRWNPEWERILADRSRPLRARLVDFYRDYARVVLTPEWVRIFLFSGLTGQDLNQRYLKFISDRVYTRLAEELRAHCELPDPRRRPLEELELEVARLLNEKIFYLGVRKWVYNVAVPTDTDAVIDSLVTAFLNGVPRALRELHGRRR
jgi:AcrR family transcriptional regulator